MSVISIVMLIFSILGGIDYILKNKFGLGEHFEKGFMLFGTMALSMIGMIIISPLVAEWLRPLFVWVHNVLHIDPSVIPAALFANDMGGAPLCRQVAVDENLGMYNALIVSAMMGCTVSFTIPFALGVVKPERHKQLLFGMLCGVVTIPIGCFFAGIMCKIPLGALLINILPLIIFSALIAAGLVFAPKKCIKIFAVFGYFMKTVIIIGLILGIVRFLSGKEIIHGLATIEEGAAVCLNASIVMSGAFPLMHVISKILSKPLRLIGKKLEINDVSAMGFVSTLATSATSFEMMNRMDEKGAVLNSAFAVSAAFTFAGHLAFTLAFDANYISSMIIGKLISGVFALILAIVIYKRTDI